MGSNTSSLVHRLEKNNKEKKATNPDTQKNSPIFAHKFYIKYDRRLSWLGWGNKKYVNIKIKNKNDELHEKDCFQPSLLTIPEEENKNPVLSVSSLMFFGEPNYKKDFAFLEALLAFNIIEVRRLSNDKNSYRKQTVWKTK